MVCELFGLDCEIFLMGGDVELVCDELVGVWIMLDLVFVGLVLVCLIEWEDLCVGFFCFFWFWMFFIMFGISSNFCYGLRKLYCWNFIRMGRRIFCCWLRVILFLGCVWDCRCWCWVCFWLLKSWLYLSWFVFILVEVVRRWMFEGCSSVCWVWILRWRLRFVGRWVLIIGFIFFC